jgi:Raf kinase inhibitor-like YbhB/YbcL family protein
LTLTKSWAIFREIKGCKMSIKLISTAFQEGGTIPEKFACDGEDLSPPLNWEGVPDDTKSLALILDDPDAPAGTWVHWVVYNLPPTIEGLSEGVIPEREIKGGGFQGMNDFRKIGYGGPCPPEGEHRYFFKLYALDTLFPFAAGVTKAQLMIAMEGHVIEETHLMGRYRR